MLDGAPGASVPVSSAKVHPLIWTANTMVDELAVNVVGFHSLLLLLVWNVKTTPESTLL